MNDLQLALLAVAATLLIALFVWSKWQERRALQQFERSLQSGVGDALLTPQAAPVATVSEAPVAPVAFGFKQTLDAELNLLRKEPTFADADARAEPPAEGETVLVTPAPVTVPHDWIEDPMLDCVIELRCAHAVDGVTVFDAVAPLSEAQLPLPTHVVVWDARNQQWIKPDRFGFYTELLVAVQLVHRHAKLTEVEVARFLAAVEQIAVRLDADFDAPEVGFITQAVAQLEQTVARFDVQVSVTLVSTGGPWDSTQLAHATVASGFVRADSQRWECRDDFNRTLFALLSASLLADRLTLELDVPLVPTESESLGRMFDAAASLATQLSARVVDDNGRDIDGASTAAIESQLAALLSGMRAAGIEPGGARAQRLYGPL